MALVHAGLGELDEAFEHLNDAVEQRHTSLLLIRTSVRGWGGLRKDPRFGELCTKIGLAPRDRRQATHHPGRLP